MGLRITDRLSNLDLPLLDEPNGNFQCHFELETVIFVHHSSPNE